eukprot:CAMPEP_0204912178 /NCGR_PEP_ID=MMETSP1397-20131031/10374_1 /ASSEMBLY_ACC=CAM_ASM_000891 /TAXON_ID=49980 /ORGANISM="Climacostomum Climacostomum virens, Strain Stock W-24" /LENGTH=517 /DNA_ID=CAMNT_0052083023 /DNA_START=53 /DNA_END=1603 /DNA_ORIENTATION=-
MRKPCLLPEGVVREYLTQVDCTELPGLEQEIQDFCRETIESLLDFRDSYTPKLKAMIIECLSIIKLDENLDLMIRALQTLRPSEAKCIAVIYHKNSMRGMLQLARWNEAFKEKCIQCLNESIKSKETSVALAPFIEHLEAGDLSSTELDISYNLKDLLAKCDIVLINKYLGCKEWQGGDLAKFKELRQLEARLRIDEEFRTQSFKVIDSMTEASFDFRVPNRIFPRLPRSLFLDDYCAYYEAIQEILDCNEASQISNEFLVASESVKDFLLNEDHTDQQIDLKAEYAKMASTSIFSKVKDLILEHMTIPTSILFYLMKKDHLMRVRSGWSQELPQHVENVVEWCWDNYDNLKLFTCKIHLNRAQYLVFDLKRDLSQTLLVEGPALSLKCRIAVYEGFLYVIDDQQCSRYSINDGFWQELPRLPRILEDFSIVVKKETRKLYALKQRCEECVILELSLTNLRHWTTLNPDFHKISFGGVVIWVDVPSTPTILFLTKEDKIFSFNLQSNEASYAGNLGS